MAKGKIDKYVMQEIIMAEYGYWATNGNIEAMGACANILAALIIYPRVLAGGSIVRKIKASELPDETLATSFDLTVAEVQQIRKQPNE